MRGQERSYWKKETGGWRKKGRLGLNWMDDVELGLRNMGVKKLGTRALDRTEWASALREYKVKLKVL